MRPSVVGIVHLSRLSQICLSCQPPPKRSRPMAGSKGLMAFMWSGRSMLMACSIWICTASMSMSIEVDNGSRSNCKPRIVRLRSGTRATLLKTVPLRGLLGLSCSFEQFVEQMAHQARAFHRLRCLQERKKRMAEVKNSFTVCPFSMRGLCSTDDVSTSYTWHHFLVSEPS
jgi:hypothetical protein